MPENNIQILSTRKLREETLKEAMASGISIEVVPFIKTISLSTEGLKKQVDGISNKYANIIFTSSNAVEAVMAIVKNKETQWRIYCTAPQTKKTLLNYFGEEKIAGTAASAGELATLVMEEGSKAENVFFCGDQHREELPALFNQHELPLKQVVVYKTELTPAELAKEYDGIIFFSPSAVKSYFSCNLPGKETVLFAIGETTAAELRERTENEILVADHPSEDWLLKKIIERSLVRK